MPHKKVRAKSAKQVRLLFSAGSPLSEAQQQKLAGEIRSGTVKIKGKARKKK